MKIPSELDFFYPGKGVSDTQISSYVADLYTKLQNITEGAAPCILSGAQVIKTGNIYICRYGSFRYNNIFINNQLMPVFGIAEEQSLNIDSTAEGWIVARYAVSSNALNLPAYLFPVSYQFVSVVSGTTDVVIAKIVKGAIDNITVPPNYFLNSPANLGSILGGVDNSQAITMNNLSNIFKGLQGHTSDKKGGYFCLPGYASNLFTVPAQNPCPRLQIVYGSIEDLVSIDIDSSAVVNFDTSILSFRGSPLSINFSGFCIIRSENKEWVASPVQVNMNKSTSSSFTLTVPIIGEGKTSYAYTGSYIAIGYSSN